MQKIFDKNKEFIFSIQIGESKIRIPFGLFLGIFGGAFIIAFIKAAKSL